RPRLDVRQLPLLLQRRDLRPDPLGDGVVLCALDAADDRSRLPVRVLARPLRAEAAAANAARARDPSFLDELPAAGLLVAEHPRRPGCDQPPAAMDARHRSSGLVLPLRPARGSPRASLPLFPF